MRIGLLSDTHVPQAVTMLPVELERAFDGVDLILHAGDIFQSSALD
ncbi:MAG TPA: metallophosphoesterase family protein, partial [Dehalococcoidia bacterium]|nr:metallophosphoesterase family protein [Dehalococcoidia bacterium]